MYVSHSAEPGQEGQVIDEETGLPMADNEGNLVAPPAKKLGTITNPNGCCSYSYSIYRPDEEGTDQYKFSVSGCQCQPAFCCPCAVACCPCLCPMKSGTLTVKDVATGANVGYIHKSPGTDACFDICCGLGNIKNTNTAKIFLNAKIAFELSRFL